MGDRRFVPAYERVRDAANPVAEVRALEDEDVVAALAAASGAADPLLANVLATELQNRVRRTGAVSASLGDGVLAADWSGRVTFLNGEAERMLRCARAETVGRPLQEVVRPRTGRGEGVPDDEHPLLGVLRTGETAHRDDLLLAPAGGAPFPMEFTASPILDEGVVRGVVVVFRDVTARKRGEAERLREVLEATLGGGFPSPGRSEAAEAAARSSGAVGPPEAAGSGRADASLLVHEGPSGPLMATLDYPFLDKATVAFFWASLASLFVLLFTPLGGPAFGAEMFVPLPALMAMGSQPHSGVLMAGLAIALGGTAAWRWLAPRNHYAWRLTAAAGLSLFAPLFAAVVSGSGQAQAFLLLVAVWTAMWADWRIPWVSVMVGLLEFSLLQAVSPAWYDTSELTPERLVLRLVPAAGAAAVSSLLSRAYYRSVTALESARGVLAADLAERKRSEEALRESEGRFRKMFDHAHDAIFLVNAEGDEIVDANPAAAGLLGYTREDLLTRVRPSALHREEMPAFQQFLVDVATAGHAWSDSLTCQHRLGHRIPTEISATTVELGGRRLLLAIVRDVSERKRREERFRLYEAAAENGPHGILWVRPDGSIRYANEHAARRLGVARRELLQLGLFDLAPELGPDTWSAAWERMRLEGGIRLETVHLRADGAPTPLSVRATCIDTDGDPFACMFLTDAAVDASRSGRTDRVRP